MSAHLPGADHGRPMSYVMGTRIRDTQTSLPSAQPPSLSAFLQGGHLLEEP